MKIEEIIKETNRILDKKYKRAELEDMWNYIHQNNLSFPRYIFDNVCELLNIE